MANRYVWERYDDEYTLSSSNMGSTQHYFDSSDGLSINREAWMMTEERSTPRYSSVGGGMSGDAFSRYNNFNEGDEEICYFVCIKDPDRNTVRECWGAGGDRIMVEYNDSISIRVAVVGGARNLRHYTTQRDADHDDPRGSVSSASSGAYPTDGWRSPYWYVYQGADTIDPASVTIPASIQGGTSIDITVTPSTGKKYGGTVSYTYQYKLDNGRWQALSGPTTATTQQLTVPKGTASVQVQVRAQDNLGFTSSTWVASASVEVTNNQPPTAPGSIDVANVVSGQEATITLTAATDPDGSIASYIYQRSVDSGMWQQFAQANTLTQTDTVSNSWGTVQYRACAVDNEGAQGPFATSTIYTVTSGLLVIGGPNPSLGELDRQFKLALNINVTGMPSLTDIDVQATLDGASIYTGQVDSGGVATIPVDARLLYTGAHTIRVTVSHDDYEPATAEYTFTVPTVSKPDGGRALVGQTPDGEPAFFYTTAQAVFCQGGTLADVLVALQGESASPLLEPVVKAAPPSGSYALSPGVLYDFTQANASALTFTFEAPAAGKAAAYHVMFKCGSTAATVNLPDGVRTPDGYVIEAGRVYELSILQNMLAYQSWGAS